MPVLAAIDPGPLENRREYGSKPASRAKTTETFPPIGSVPLIPINELDSAWVARVKSDPLFFFWIRYELPTADRGSHGAPWLCQPNPVSIAPYPLMPGKVSRQFVAIKLQPSVHALGA